MDHPVFREVAQTSTGNATYAPCSPRGTRTARPAAAAAAGRSPGKPPERVANLRPHPRRCHEQHDGVDEELGVDDHVADEDGELWQEPSPGKMRIKVGTFCLHGRE